MPALILSCRNDVFFTRGADAYNDPKMCPYNVTSHGLRGLQETANHDSKIDVSEFLRATVLWMLVSAGLSVLLGWAYLQLFKHHSGLMTRMTVRIMY